MPQFRAKFQNLMVLCSRCIVDHKLYHRRPHEVLNFEPLTYKLVQPSEVGHYIVVDIVCKDFLMSNSFVVSGICDS